MKQWSKKTGVTRGEGRGGAREEGEKEAIKGEKKQVGKERQRWKEKLLRIQTQACTIQPCRMGRTHAA